jgi:hypothetical protein
MSEYSGIRGTRVKYLASDPTLNTSTEGQVWYNSTSGTLKSLVQIKAWSAGGNMGTARYNLAGAGTQTAALAFNGSAYPNPPNPRTNATEEYSGFSWAAGGTLNTTTLGAFGFGTQTAAVAASGDNNTPTWEISTQEYNGSAWTTVNNMTTVGRRNGDAVGILTAGVAFGGNVLPSGYTNATEEYDGTNWTAGGNLTTAREGFQAAGTQTAAFAAGGYNGSYTSNVEEYDGSTWTTAGGNLPTARGSGSGSGIQTNALIFAGSDPAATATSLQYDGTVWTASATMGTARGGLASAQSGTAVAALGFGGYVPGTATAATEEYFSSIDNYSPSTVSAWASGGNTVNNGRGQFAATTGTQTAGLIFGGEGPLGFLNATEEYNGSNWTTGGNLPLANALKSGAGTQTDTLQMGGYTSPGGESSTVNSYNGSTWSSETSLPSGVSGAASAGSTSTAGLIFGGLAGITNALEYDGSSWGSPTNMSQARNNHGGAGTQTTAIALGGENGPTVSVTEGYNGTSWTTLASLNTARGRAGALGSSSLALALGNTPYTGATEIYDGTGWSTTASMATGRSGGGHNLSTTVAGLVTANGGPSGGNQTEEFTQGSPASPTGAAASTLTTS